MKVPTNNSSASCERDLLDDLLDFSKVEAGKLDLEHTQFELKRLLDTELIYAPPGSQEPYYPFRCL